jgi:hypothetical protein
MRICISSLSTGANFSMADRSNACCNTHTSSFRLVRLPLGGGSGLCRYLCDASRPCRRSQPGLHACLSRHRAHPVARHATREDTP